MNSIIDDIKLDSNWIEYLEYKKSQKSMSKYEIRVLSEYILNAKNY